jgi:class 3 adenylate cyclase
LRNPHPREWIWWDNPAIAIAPMSYLYRRLGARYPQAFLAVELHSALVVVAATLALFSFYYDGTASEYLMVLGIALVTTELSVLATLHQSRRHIAPIRRWIDGERDTESAAAAWSAAVGLPLVLVERDLRLPVAATVLISCGAGVVILDLSWLAFFPLLAGSLVSAAYGAMLHYLAVEGAMRPVLVDINSQIAPRTAAIPAVSLRARLLVALPLINLITGLVVAALTTDGGGNSNLGVDVLIALAVATTIALELTVLLSKSILSPIGDLERAVDAINAGDYSGSVPVTTGDELGALTASFNQMVEGLRERERIREAFGTYLDREIAEYILSDGFDEEGAEIEVSILFCDVRDFTRFAETASPQQVVATLNGLFEVIVPIIAQHGGHVDKFEGDGLLAVFGAPEPFLDHAERAVHAACAISKAVNEQGEAGELRVGVGVNTGLVVAGAVGGAGRLNFSVIGRAVNLAARVEEATRELGDPILITTETWKRLGTEFEAESRGKVEVRGISDPVSVHVPRLRSDAKPAEQEPMTVSRSGMGRLRRLARPRLRP